MIPTAEDLLYYCRLVTGMSMREVAERAGVPIPSVFNWEHGKCEPRFRAVVACLDAMGFELELRKKGEER